MSKFQIITIFIFIIAIVAGVVAFATYKGGSDSQALPAITIWGTFPEETFNEYLGIVNSGLVQSLNVTYVEKKAENFSLDFVKALALGQGPDAILIPADQLLSEKNKLTPIPFSALSQRDYLDAYIGQSRIYISDQGFWAVPFMVDPLVMYWNRDLFNKAGLALYPKTWDEFAGNSLKPGLVQKLAVKDQNGNLKKAAVAMGDFTNITNARELLGTLFMQTGNNVTNVGNDGLVYSTLNARSASDASSVVPALQFFANFSNPIDANYSWNRAMPNDKTAFLSGTLATYFGLASELFELREKNPNIDYDVAPLPEWKGGQKVVYGKLYGFSIVTSSAKANTAFQAISILVAPTNLAELSKMMYLPPVRNDLIAQGSPDPYIAVFNRLALISRSWMDDPEASKQIFGNMVQSIIGGAKSADEAVREAGDQYDAALKRAGQ